MYPQEEDIARRAFDIFKEEMCLPLGINILLSGDSLCLWSIPYLLSADVGVGHYTSGFKHLNDLSIMGIRYAVMFFSERVAFPVCR